ncbi:MAG: fumarylacetoacetate hydrolase family protein [Bacteroidota bacterium]
MNLLKIILAAFVLVLAGLGYYLFRPLTHTPIPADCTCQKVEDGSFLPMDSLPAPGQIFGMGLTYAKHLEETASEYDPAAIPPIFYKSLQSLTYDGATVPLPSQKELIAAAGTFEREVATHVEAEFDALTAMLDYEVELGFMLLEDINPAELKAEGYIPQLGFFVANDLSARSIALLGEGTSQRYEYWGVSKSFPGFLPLSQQLWISTAPTPNSLPCVNIETYVNGTQRQSQNTSDMMYTPLEMLRFIPQKYPDVSLKKGDIVLTGTPGGVALATPRFLVRLANLIGFDRYKKLSIKLEGDQSLFLKKGDVVEVKAEGIGSVKNEIVGG